MQIKNSYVIKSWILVEHFFFNYVFTLCADEIIFYETEKIHISPSTTNRC